VQAFMASCLGDRDPAWGAGNARGWGGSLLNV
jgi:hypothetical protein